MKVDRGMVAPGTKTVDSPFYYFFHRIYYYSPLSIDLVDSVFEYFEEIHPWLEDTCRVKGPRGQGIGVVMTWHGTERVQILSGLTRLIIRVLEQVSSPAMEVDDGYK